MRLERVAYKKIASHLDKTELACRLHYHQLSHGGNRRKRNNSISSTASVASSPTSPAAATSPAASSSSSTADGPSAVAAAILSHSTGNTATSSFSPVNAHGAIQKMSSAGSSSNGSTLKAKGKPLLPKPSSSSTTSASGNPLSGAGVGAGRKNGGGGGAAGKKQALRVNCNTELAGMGGIDTAKLRKIVETQQAQFWESVAAQYAGGVDAAYLRRVWHQQSGGGGRQALGGLLDSASTAVPPPTPGISPASNQNSPLASAAQSPAPEDLRLHHHHHHLLQQQQQRRDAVASEVATPASAMSPAAVDLCAAGEITSIKEDPMEVDPRPVVEPTTPEPHLMPQPVALAMAS